MMRSSTPFVCSVTHPRSASLAQCSPLPGLAWAWRNPFRVDTIQLFSITFNPGASDGIRPVNCRLLPLQGPGSDPRCRPPRSLPELLRQGHRSYGGGADDLRLPQAGGEGGRVNRPAPFMAPQDVAHHSGNTPWGGSGLTVPQGNEAARSYFCFRASSTHRGSDRRSLMPGHLRRSTLPPGTMSQRIDRRSGSRRPNQGHDGGADPLREGWPRGNDRSQFGATRLLLT
jgi:hypothetical protein